MSRKFLFVFVLFISALAFSGVEFDGAGEMLDCGTSTRLVGASDLTISAWIKPKAITGSDQLIVAKSTTTTLPEPYAMRFVDVGLGLIALQCQMLLSGVTYTANAIVCETTSDCFLDGAWTHIACTGDAINGLIPYVDGTAYSPTGIFGTLPKLATNFTIGRYNSGSMPYNGIVTDVAVYSRALSGSEIANLASSRKRNTITDGRLGYWPMDDLRDGTSIASGSSDIIDRTDSTLGSKCAGDILVGGGILYAEEYINRF